MKNLKKRFLSLCLCIVMLFGIIPMDVFATVDEVIPVESELSEQPVLEEQPALEEEPVVEEEQVIEEPIIIEEIQEEAMTAEKLAELFRKLPSASSITQETSDEEKSNIMAQLEEVVSAFDEMTENNPEEAQIFEENYAQLYLDAMDLNDALTGNESEMYAHYDYNWRGNNFTIKVINESGDVLYNNVTVTVADDQGNTYGVGGQQWYQQFAFTKQDNNRQYIITVSHDDYQTNSVTISGKNSSTTITLKEVEEDLSGENWYDFNVYYISTGKLPDSYAGAGDASDYGPSGNNTPLVTIRVDINKLRREYSDVVKYEKNNGNQWHLIPVGAAKNLEAATNFWNAIKACMDNESVQAFRDTGLYEHCIIYVLKKQNDGSQHADGILNVTPPVYVIEYYDRGSYFGGSVTDKNGTFKTIQDVQTAYENHFKVDISWNSDGLTGVYRTSDNAYTITITQTNLNSAQTVANSQIKYKKETNEYYLATFDCTIREGAAGYHTVKYTDGITSENLFADQTYVVSTGSKAPAFVGDPSDKYAGYYFTGWALEGGNGTLLSAEQIAGMTVSQNMVFHAQWSRKPTEFEATVNVVLNETYAVDIDTMLGNDQAKLYVSSDDETFYFLENTAVGEYKSKVPNGTYYTYYSLDGGTNYTKIDERDFVIINAEGGRKVKFNSVSYALAGGTSDPVIPSVSYYHAGTSVNVSSVVPRKDNYIFAGWKNSDGTIYDSGKLLTSYIVNAYTLTAQWEKAVDVEVTVIINHGNDTTEKNDEVTFSLVEVRNGATIHTGVSKTLTETSCDGFDFVKDDANKKLTYNPTKLTFTGLKNVDYTLNCFKTGYKTSVSKTVSDDVQKITLTLDYSPEYFALNFDVKISTAVMDTPDLWPQAVRIKAIRWEENGWVVVPQHENTSVLVTINQNGTGSGQVNVPQYWPNVQNQAADYRIIITEYVMPDGTTVSANQNPGGKYTSSNGIYEGIVSVENGGRTPTYPKVTNVESAYYNSSKPGQDGTPTALISINSYSVTFKADTVSGGKVNGKDSHKIDNQIKIPVFSGYTMKPPSEGYIFEGWYSKDGSSSGDWGDKIVAGTGLSNHVTVYAKWKEPITIEGNVFVAGSYIENGHEIAIYDHDRIGSVTVVLRKSGLGGNMKSVNVPVTYSANNNLGTGTYTFSYIPNDGSDYYIEVISSNYDGYFQNEPESIQNVNALTTYTKDDNDALLGSTEPLTATVNAYLKFDPASFNLKYQVDATAISDDFRPETTEVLVTYKDEKIVSDPSMWTVISQMIYGGNVITLTEGLGSGSTSVWNGFHDGATLYEYGMRINDVTGLGEHTGTDVPYSVVYQDPAYYVTGGQSKLLKATMTPNKYEIYYELGIDSTAVVGMTNAPKEHTWSYDTAINVKPIRSGYEFLGWYDNAQFTGIPVTKIDAKVSEETTLYAKWLQVQDKVNLTVEIIHKAQSGDGLASNYDKELFVQLTQSLKDSNYPYESVTGKIRGYGGKQWHTKEDGVEKETFTVNNIFTNLSSAYAYSLNVSLDNYIVTNKVVTATKDDETGITTYDVQIVLQFVPDLLYLHVNAEIADGIKEDLWPVSAEVKINCWYDHPSEEIGLKWNTITQHENTTLTITFDEEGTGNVSYPVWQWFDKAENIPYYYRMEVVSIHLKDGSVVTMSGNEERYKGGAYLADIVTDNCAAPSEPAGTTLPGAYGKTESDGYSQIGTVTAVISTDIWKDETPDHMQAEISFASADVTKGTVSGAVSQVFDLDNVNGSYKKTVKPVQPALTAVSGYEFSHWTNGKGESVENPFADQEVLGGKTYTYIAHWKPLSNLKYTVQYLDMDDKAIKTAKTAVNQTFGSKIQSSSEVLTISGYVFDHADVPEIVIDVAEANNVIKLYYAKDDNDDGIADYKQAFVKFLSADAKGTVIGKTDQIFTFTSESGYKGTVNPETVILTAAEGYKFSRWTNQSGETVENPFKSQSYEGGNTYTYTAHWTERTDYSYTVKYLNKEDNSSIADDKEVTGKTFNSIVTENAIMVDGYTLDGNSTQSFTVDVNNKEIVFYYNIRKDLTLTVKHRDWENKEAVLHPDTTVNELTFKSSPNLTVLRADIYGYEYHSTSPESIKIGTGENVVTIYYTKKDCNYRVEYYYDDVIDNEKTVTGTAVYGSVINTYTAKEKTGYTLDYVQGIPLTLDVNAASNVIRVHYAKDVNNDDIPDKYQAVVTFKIIDGTWTTGGNLDIVRYYTLWEYNNGVLTSVSKQLGEIPTGNANEGYNEVGVWSPQPAANTPVIGDATYVLSYSIKKFTIEATVTNGTAKVNNAPFSYVEVPYSESNTTITFEALPNYTLDTVYVDGVAAELNENSYTFNHKADHHIHVSYAKDVIGGENGGDGIPDKYQATVVYNVVNGTWSDSAITPKSYLFTIYEKNNGTWNPKNVSLGATIPSGMKPNTGYSNGVWMQGITAATPVTRDASYTYAFSLNDYVISVNVINGTAKEGNPDSTSTPFTSKSFEVDHSESASSVFSFTANANYALESITVDGQVKEFDSENKNFTYVVNHKGPHAITVVYAEDKNNNGIPDKYEATVTFKIIDGVWTSYGSTTKTGNDDIICDYPLYEESNGSWVKLSNVTIGTIPLGTGNEGYINGVWTPALSSTTEVTDDAVYTLSYTLKNITISAVVVNGTATVDNITFNSVEVPYSKEQTTTIGFEPADNSYVLDIVRVNGVEKSLSAASTYTLDHKSDHIIYVTFEKDLNNDDIPDKYQKKVTYRIVNGKWCDGTATDKTVYLTLKTGEKYDVNGTASYKAPKDMKPAAGYTINGKWDATPPTEFRGTNEEIYTYRYNEKVQISIRIDVTGGTSYPVHSSTVYDYDANMHKIEFTPYAGYILDTAKIKSGDITNTGTWSVLSLTESSENQGSYKYNHNHSKNEHIQVVFAKDSNKDNIPDYKQAFVKFQTADDKGTVSGNTNQVFTFTAESGYQGTVNPATVTLTAAEGYTFSHWTNQSGARVENPFASQNFAGDNTYTFTANWVPRSDLKYTVKYIDESGNSIRESKIVNDAVYGTTIYAKDEKIEIDDYVFIRADKESLTIGVSENVLTLTYGKDVWKDTPEGNDNDTDGDNCPDSKQALIRFVSSNNDLGTVSGKEMIQVFTIHNGDSDLVVPVQVGLNPADNCEFSHWTEEGNTEHVNPYKPLTITGNMEKTYVAHWTVNYTVNHLDLDGQTIRTSEIVTKNEIGTKIDCLMHKKDDIQGYVFDHAEANEITLKVGANVVNLYYAEDKWSDPTKDTDETIPGDGIADKFQIKVNYHATPEMFGSVSKAYDIYTITDANGEPVTQGNVKVRGVEATAKAADENGKCTFVNWTDSVTRNTSRTSLNGDLTKPFLELVLEANGGKEYHFYANFRYEMNLAAIYFVEHYLWNSSENKYVLDEKETFVGRAYIDEEVTAQSVKYSGYTLNESKSVMKGIVTEPVEDPETLKPTNVLTLKLYYDVKVQNKDHDHDSDDSDSSSENVSESTSGNTTNTISGNVSSAVNTGDSSNIGTLICMLCVSIVGILGLSVKRRRKDIL